MGIDVLVEDQINLLLARNHVFHILVIELVLLRALLLEIIIVIGKISSASALYASWQPAP